MKLKLSRVARPASFSLSLSVLSDEVMSACRMEILLYLSPSPGRRKREPTITRL